MKTENQPDVTDRQNCPTAVRSSDLLAGASVQLRKGGQIWKAFILVDQMQLLGQGYSPGMALAELACTIDSWQHAFDAPANDKLTDAGGRERPN